MSNESNNNIENGKKVVKYVQEHAAGLTLLATIAITVGSILLKYIYYLIELGYTKNFNISASYIDLADDNILYAIVANGVISLFFALIKRCFLIYEHLLICIIIPHIPICQYSFRKILIFF